MGPFYDALRAISNSCGLPLTAEQLEKMASFYALLEEANRSFNLTSIEGPTEAAQRHFVDSLAAPALALLRPGIRVIDVGTGAGFPGVPLAIYRSDLSMTLLDSMKKRTGFLEVAVKSLGLTNVKVLTARAEEYSRGAGRERYDAALSRAVAPLNILLEYLLPFLKTGGKALAWKGPSAVDEITLAANACRQLGGGEMKPHSYSLPDRKPFYIVEIEKIRHTPSLFPRKTGKPSSDPLI